MPDGPSQHGAYNGTDCQLMLGGALQNVSALDTRACWEPGTRGAVPPFSASPALFPPALHLLLLKLVISA